MVSREVMATILTMSGYLVQTASDGYESLSLLNDDSFVPDVILMDTQMPGLSGTELIHQLRAMHGVRQRSRRPLHTEYPEPTRRAGAAPREVATRLAPILRSAGADPWR